MNKEIYERILLNQLSLLESLVVALPLGNRRGVQDSITQTERLLRKMELASTGPVNYGSGSGGGGGTAGNHNEHQHVAGGGAGGSSSSGVQQPPE